MKELSRSLMVVFFTFSLGAVALADAPSIPESDALSKEEIEALLTGRTFEFTGYDEPIVGTTEWDFRTGYVSGSYVWDGSEKGEFKTEMFIDEESRLCTVQKRGTICQVVYRYEDGFMEVTPEGVVHAVSKPVN